jgi:hypothetical protein
VSHRDAACPGSERTGCYPDASFPQDAACLARSGQVICGRANASRFRRGPQSPQDGIWSSGAAPANVQIRQGVDRSGGQIQRPHPTAPPKRTRTTNVGQDSAQAQDAVRRTRHYDGQDRPGHRNE